MKVSCIPSLAWTLVARFTFFPFATETPHTKRSTIALSPPTHAQFYRQSEQYGVAFTSLLISNGSEIFVHIEAPTSYQWAAIGTGDKTDGSFMLLIKPSSNPDR